VSPIQHRLERKRQKAGIAVEGHAPSRDLDQILWLRPSSRDWVDRGPRIRDAVNRTLSSPDRIGLAGAGGSRAAAVLMNRKAKSNRWP
jgi:hypothetical protein